MKIDINKQYKTSMGEPVRILCTDRDNKNFPVVAIIGKDSVRNYSEIGEIFGKIELVEIGPYDHIKINDRVLVKMNNDRLGLNPVFRRYFAGVNENGKPTTFARGDLWSSINRVCPLDKALLEEWDHAELWEEDA